MKDLLIGRTLIKVLNCSNTNGEKTNAALYYGNLLKIKNTNGYFFLSEEEYLRELNNFFESDKGHEYRKLSLSEIKEDMNKAKVKFLLNNNNSKKEKSNNKIINNDKNLDIKGNSVEIKMPSRSVPSDGDDYENDRHNNNPNVENNLKEDFNEQKNNEVNNKESKNNNNKKLFENILNKIQNVINNNKKNKQENKIRYIDNDVTLLKSNSKISTFLENKKVIYGLVGLLILLLIVGISLFTSITKETVSIPNTNNTIDLVGMKEDVADNYINEETQVIKKYEFNEKIKKGDIISQEIKEENGIKYINIIISNGKEIKQEDILSTPNFINSKKDRVEKWAKDNNINIEYSYIETLKEKDIITDQYPKENEQIIKGDTIKITITADKIIYVPNITGLTLNSAKSELNKNNLKNSVSYRYSDTVKKNIVINIEPKANTNITKNGLVKLTISLGSPSIPNYSGKSYSSAYEEIKTLNARGANISVVKVDEYSKDVEFGKIISQSDTGTVSTNQTIKFIVSKGEDNGNVSFVGKTIDYTLNWLNKRDYKVNCVNKYSDTISKNIVISSEPTDLNNNSTVNVTYSLGKYEVENLLGKSKADILAILEEANSKGANITHSFIEVNNGSYDAGKCCEYTVDGNNVVISISKGNMVTVSNYIDKSLTEFQSSGICSLLSCNLILDGYTDELITGDTKIISNDYGDFMYGDSIDIHYVKGE